MQPQDVLPTLAEIAVTLAGFTAILFAVQSSFTDSTPPGQGDRVLAILAIPASVFLCALLPFGLAGFSSSPALVWGVPLCVYAVTHGLLASRTAVRLFRGTTEVTWPTLVYGMLVVAWTLNLATLASGLGFLVPFSPGILVLSLVWSLMSAGSSLVAAVRAAISPPAV